MRSIRLSAAALAAATLPLAAPAGHAAPVTIAVDAFPVGDFTSGVEDGFDISASNSRMDPLAFSVPGLCGPDHVVIADAGVEASLTITGAGGGTCAFQRLRHQATGSPVNIRVQGFPGGTSKFDDVFQPPEAGIPGNPAEPFAPNGYTAIDSFVSSTARRVINNAGIDDIVFGQPAVVPLAAAASLLIGGLGALDAAARRKPKA